MNKDTITPPVRQMTATQMPVTEMTDKIPLSARNFLPAIFVFTLPWLMDVIVFAGTSDAGAMFNAPKGLFLNGLYASAPFFLTALAMRPRLRVSRALWGGAIVTAIIWAILALIGRSNQINPNPESGAAFLWMFILVMIWPCVVTVLMGGAAKFKEAPLEGSFHE